MDIPDYSELYVLSDDVRKTWLDALGAAFTNRLLTSENFETEVEVIIDQLRGAGYDLYMFDSNGKWQLWCGDWTAPQGRSKLILRVDPSTGAELTWSDPGADSMHSEKHRNYEKT